MLATHARFLLRAEHARTRLESDARKIRRAPSVRESSQRSDLSDRRNDLRTEHWPRLRRGRRTARYAARETRLARRRTFAGFREQGLQDRQNPAGRELGQTHQVATHCCWRKRESRGLHRRGQRDARFVGAKYLSTAHLH